MQIENDLTSLLQAIKASSNRRRREEDASIFKYFSLIFHPGTALYKNSQDRNKAAILIEKILLKIGRFDVIALH